jgi:ABC-type sugar transport system ATPase subunit
MSYLEMVHVTKTYKTAASPVLEDLNLSVEKGEILVILGVSGCGKTTMLKIVAGIERQNSGSVVLDGVVLDDVPPEKRSAAMVFQKSLLFRNMTVEENINFAPRLNRSCGKAELKRRTDEMLTLLQLEGMGKKRATELSGGQEQRVSLGRALMSGPKLLLLDEPLSSLDADLKWELATHIKALNTRLGTTMLYVTHDRQEAETVASRIAVLRGGKIQYEERHGGSHEKNHEGNENALNP